MPHNLKELAELIARRDDIDFEEADELVQDTAIEMERAFYSGSLNEAEDILRCNLGLELDYLDLFIF